MTSTLLRLVAFVLFAAQAQTPSQLTITVSDATGGRVANTPVVLSRGTQEFGGTANDEGVLVLRDVAAGEWTLTIQKEGFLQYHQPVTVGNGALDVPVTLEVAGLNQILQIETTVGPPNPIQLDTTATGGTLLDIPVRELPASLSLIPQELIQERGARSAIEAVQLTVGMVGSTGVGSIPGFSTRGWGSGDISVMRDGIRQNTNAQSARPTDTFILDRVEVLKGPGSLPLRRGRDRCCGELHFKRSQALVHRRFARILRQLRVGPNGTWHQCAADTNSLRTN